MRVSYPIFGMIAVPSIDGSGGTRIKSPKTATWHHIQPLFSEMIYFLIHWDKFVNKA